jgi:hypothetical protein
LKHRNLDQIQAAALKICVGAKNTLIEILQVELDEQPLLRSIYRDSNVNSKIQIPTKASIIPNRPAKLISQDHWTNYFGELNITNTSIKKTKLYMEKLLSANIKSPKHI